MDSRASEKTKSRTLRRSTRQSSRKVLIEPDVRGPLKRTRKVGEKQAPVAAVNGSRDVENDSEDGESPGKKRRLETAEVSGSGDGNDIDMDVHEQDEDLEDEKNEDQEMDIGQDSSNDIHQPKICQDALGDVNYSPRVVLSKYLISSDAVNEPKKGKPSIKAPVTPTKSVTQIRLQATRPVVPPAKITSKEEYKRKIQAKARSSDMPTVNHHFRVSERYYARQQPVNNIPKQKDSDQHQETGIKKIPFTKTSSAKSSRGFMWCFWCLVLPVLLSTSAVLLAYKIFPVLQKMADEHPSKAVQLEKFADHFTRLQTLFPRQRNELWRRCKIHLEKHLKTAQPTEPVSLILTAGFTAEKTMHCLAQQLASSFSSALNGSVLHIDGASKAGHVSDEVKLDIDSQLQAAFAGDQPVAVIHRFEELPPGSTLIFYRYCDHENAAYKQVFLLFTVLLPQDEVRDEQNLKEVEEMVQDYVQKRLVASSHQATFNEMDADKFGGLWSRISHLILPVVSEDEVEQNGCQ